MAPNLPSTPASANLLRTVDDRTTFIVVATFTNPIEAEVARGHLESHGIRAFLKDDGIVGVAWHLSNAVGGVKVLVDEPDAEAARLLLQNPGGAPDDEPTVHSESDRFAQRAWRASILGMLVPLVMHLYSLRLLVLCVMQPDALSTRGRYQAAGALVFNVVILAWALAWVRFGWMPVGVTAY